MAQGLSDREAAKVAGISHQAIGKARKSGRIQTLDDGTIAVAALEKWLEGRRTPRGGNHRGVAEKALPAPAVASVDGDAARRARAALEATLAPAGLYVDRAAAELARDSYQARLRQLEYEEKAGRLLDGETVKRHIAAGCAKVRSRLLSIPSEKAPAIARLKTAGEVRDALEAAVTEALEELAGHFDEEDEG